MWAVDNLYILPLDELPSVRFKVAMKDPEEARGKKMCVKGRILEIEAERTELGKIYNGLLTTRGYGGFEVAPSPKPLLPSSIQREGSHE